jgi:hypothetical protein
MLRVMSRTSRLLALVLVAAALAGCNSVKPVEVLEPVDVTTGWYDAGILEDGKNKLVPSVSLKLRNKSGEPIDGVQINAIFRRVNEQEMWGEHYGWAVQREQLAPGQATKDIVLRSALGYTGEQPRMQILQHKDFIDAKVEVYLKKGSQVWAKLGEFPIERQLLTQ